MQQLSNATLVKKGDILTITVDMSKTLGLSRSGKSMNIATSSGNKQIEGTDAVIGLNIYKKA